MPPPQGAAAPDSEGRDSAELPPPPSFSRQLAQLVIIPAAIVIICIGLAVLFGFLAGGKSDIHSNLLKLRQSSGKGRMAFDIQDPRYKDRGLAAYNIATLIPTIKDPVERARIAQELTDILRTNVGDDEDLLRVYLLLAIGQLGQDGGLAVLIDHLAMPRPDVRQGAVVAILNWPDRHGARVAVPALTAALGHDDEQVLATAAAALGELATSEDQAAILALRQVLERTGNAQREAKWNAAVALARLGDARGSAIVADLLLDREALSKLPAAETGAASRQPMPRGMQDRLILSTLMAAGDMTDPRIWGKIEGLANDPNGRVKTRAAELLLQQRATEGQ